MRQQPPPEPQPLPMEVLQRLGAFLPAADICSARLACRAWRDCLGAQVSSVLLPPALWQRPGRGQLAQLRRLAAAFPLLRAATLLYERASPGLAPIAPQLLSLDLSDLCWPPPPSMAALAGALSGLQRLRLHSSVFSRLTAEHVEAVAGMARLRELSLGFRTVDGTGASPMALDPLTRLSRLTFLDLEYTGLLELSNGVGFRRPQDLSRLSALTALSVRHVPLPCLSGLAALCGLRTLHLLQTAPVSAKQAGALARCTALGRLEVEPLPFELLPSLSALTRLRSLSVHLHQLHRGRLPAAAADALLALEPLSSLASFALSGQIEVGSDHIAALAAAWPGLRSLDLCCGLSGGTVGFGALSALRRLRLSPFHWDAWSAEAPLLLHPAELPESLTCLEARDVWVAAPGPDAARLGAAPRASDFSWVAGAPERGGGGWGPAAAALRSRPAPLRAACARCGW
ncbi:MAG: hypothetical protein J3K34DRAFT_428122 [Monoraphidium minutum]|nr:MAG: hypothetical protein J3K34DRAFT_428122 [Monoraphidium minutum]